MAAWMKIDDDLVSKPKVLRIARQLQLPPWQAVGALMALWGWLNAHGAGPWSREDLDGVVAMYGLPSNLVAALVGVGYAEETDAGLVVRLKGETSVERSARMAAMGRSGGIASGVSRGSDAKDLEASTKRTLPYGEAHASSTLHKSAKQTKRKSKTKTNYQPTTKFPAGAREGSSSSVVGLVGGGDSLALQKAKTELIAKRGEAEGTRVFEASLGSRITFARTRLGKFGIGGEVLERAITATLEWPFDQWSERFERLITDARAMHSPSGIVLTRLGIAGKKAGAA